MELSFPHNYLLRLVLSCTCCTPSGSRQKPGNTLDSSFPFTCLARQGPTHPVFPPASPFSIVSLHMTFAGLSGPFFTFPSRLFHCPCRTGFHLGSGPWQGETQELMGAEGGQRIDGTGGYEGLQTWFEIPQRGVYKARWSGGLVPFYWTSREKGGLPSPGAKPLARDPKNSFPQNRENVL